VSLFVHLLDVSCNVLFCLNCLLYVFAVVSSFKMRTLCFIKNRTPKAGRHKFIKISSPKMISHIVHCHSVADSLCLKSLVWVEYQLHGFHGNWSSDLLRSGLTWNRRLWTRPLTSGGNDSKPASRPKDNILNIYYNFSRTCRLLVPTFFSILKPFSWSYNKKFQGPVFYETQCMLPSIVT